MSRFTITTFSQVTEIVSKIKTKNELDCKARDIVTIEEGDMDFNAALDKFANILSGDPGSNPIRGWLIFLSTCNLYTCLIIQSQCYMYKAHSQEFVLEGWVRLP